jgi:hypothetical protein
VEETGAEAEASPAAVTAAAAARGGENGPDGQSRVEPEAALLLAGPVAVMAVAGQKRLHVPHEIDGPRDRWRSVVRLRPGRGRPAGNQRSGDRDADHRHPQSGSPTCPRRRPRSWLWMAHARSRRPAGAGTLRTGGSQAEEGQDGGHLFPLLPPVGRREERPENRRNLLDHCPQTHALGLERSV